MSSPSELEPKSFRDELWELYLLWCDRKGRDPERSVSVFEVEAQLGQGAVNKVFSGDRPTIGPKSIANLLDGLYNEGQDGVITAEGRDEWRKRLTDGYISESTKQHIQRISGKITPIPSDIQADLKRLITELNKRRENLPAIGLIGSTFIARRLMGNKAVFEDHLKDNQNEWTEYWAGQLVVPGLLTEDAFIKKYDAVRKALSKGWEVAPILGQPDEDAQSQLANDYSIVLPKGKGHAPLKFPFMENFVTSTVVDNRAIFVGLVIFDKTKSSQAGLLNLSTDRSYERMMIFGILPWHRQFCIFRQFKSEKSPQLLMLSSPSANIDRNDQNIISVKREKQNTSLFINNVQVQAFSEKTALVTRVGIYDPLPSSLPFPLSPLIQRADLTYVEYYPSFPEHPSIPLRVKKEYSAPEYLRRIYTYFQVIKLG